MYWYTVYPHYSFTNGESLLASHKIILNPSIHKFQNNLRKSHMVGNERKTAFSDPRGAHSQNSKMLYLTIPFLKIKPQPFATVRFYPGSAPGSVINVVLQLDGSTLNCHTLNAFN